MSLPIKQNMRLTIEKVLASHGLKEKFEASSEFYVKISSSGFMPLIIEKHETQIIVAHYYEQNGDLVPDPDMEFVCTVYGWVPVAIQHSNGIYRRASEFDESGRLLVKKTELKSQLNFAAMWARNLKAQGFADLKRSQIVKSEDS